MKIQYTKWQTQRQCLPDQRTSNTMLLIKACSRLNLTYQIWYLAEEAEIFRHFGLNPGNLFECFVDSDGEFLIDRMIKLCEQSAASGWPVVFQ